MEVQLSERFFVTGILTRTSNQPGKAEADIPALWAKFWGEGIMEKIADRANDAVYSVYTNYESDHTGEYDILIGCRLNHLPSRTDGLANVEITAGTFRKYTAVGSLMDGVVFEKWQEIWESGDDRAFSADFEVYDERAMDTSNAEVDIFIALKA
ncbi:MAG: AraC family transcriptional regulator [Chitinophagaceae bacterium]|nr:MAG: AraC family transcriptional regulator [Chitinophagaceae bacterium]